VTHAPAQLPLAPRPISTELLSSWLLRLAAANRISLHELLEGFEAQYGRVLSNAPIDYGVPVAAVTALSRFCRVPPRAIRLLDLREQAAWLTPSMLLRFHNVGWRCPRLCSERVRYAFCPSCLGCQQVIHIPWDWSVSHLVRCAVHRRPLLDGCPACGEPDPLTLAAEDIRCRSCGDILLGDMDVHEHSLHAVEDAYRAALAGAAPAMLNKATHGEFRRFVEEMFEFLTHVLDPCSGSRPNRKDSFSRQDICNIIAVLVLNAAATSSNESIRSRLRTRGLHLWVALLSVIPGYEGHILEKASLRWPTALRRSFTSGLYYRYRKQWPYTPYRALTHLGNSVRRSEIAGLFGLD
jgi:hypothetical protein